MFFVCTLVSGFYAEFGTPSTTKILRQNLITTMSELLLRSGGTVRLPAVGKVEIFYFRHTQRGGLANGPNSEQSHLDALGKYFQRSVLWSFGKGDAYFIGLHVVDDSNGGAALSFVSSQVSCQNMVT
jgi:hypothetical protein